MYIYMYMYMYMYMYTYMYMYMYMYTYMYMYHVSAARGSKYWLFGCVWARFLKVVCSRILTNLRLIA